MFKYFMAEHLFNMVKILFINYFIKSKMAKLLIIKHFKQLFRLLFIRKHIKHNFNFKLFYFIVQD